MMLLKIKKEIHNDEYWQNYVKNKEQKHGSTPVTRKYAEHAYVLDINPYGKSILVKKRSGIIINAIADDFKFLEVLGIPKTSFEIGEKIYIGKEGRTKVLSVLGKLEYEQISAYAKSELSEVVNNIINLNKAIFEKYINDGKPITQKDIEKLISILRKKEEERTVGRIGKVFRIDW